MAVVADNGLTDGMSRLDANMIPVPGLAIRRMPQINSTEVGIRRSEAAQSGLETGDSSWMCIGTKETNES